MKFQSLFFLLLAGLISSVFAELYDGGSHGGDFARVVRAPTRSSKKTSGKKSQGSSSKSSGPAIPDGKDKSKLHVWTRITPLGEPYDDRGGVDHSGLNSLMESMGGQHCDVVVGNSGNYRQYGLVFGDNAWIKNNPNGDGAAVKVESGGYQAVAGETLNYNGELGKKMTHNKVKQIG